MSVSKPSFPGSLGGPQPNDQKLNWSSFLKSSKFAEISLLSPTAPFLDSPALLPLEWLSGNFTSYGFLAGILSESAKFFLSKSQVPLLPPQIQLNIVVETSGIRWKCTRYMALWNTFWTPRLLSGQKKSSLFPLKKLHSHYCNWSEICILCLFPLHQPSSKLVISTIYAFWSPTIQENRGDDSLAVGNCYSFRHQFSTLGEKIGSCEGWKSEKIYSVLCNDLYKKKILKMSGYMCVYNCTLCCTLETNTVLLVSYTPIKI